MPSNLTGPAVALSQVFGDPNNPSLYFIAESDYQTFIQSPYSATTMNYYDNNGNYINSVSLTNYGAYSGLNVNLPVTIQSSGLYHAILMSTGTWAISVDDLNTVTTAVSGAGEPVGLVSLEGANPLGLQNNYPTYTEGVVLTGVLPQTTNLAQVCNIIENLYLLEG